MENIHISRVRAGDAILHNGVVRTVCVRDIKKDDGFMGMSIFGDSYHSGYKLVTRVIANRC